MGDKSGLFVGEMANKSVRFEKKRKTNPLNVKPKQKDEVNFEADCVSSTKQYHGNGIDSKGRRHIAKSSEGTRVVAGYRLSRMTKCNLSRLLLRKKRVWGEEIERYRPTLLKKEANLLEKSREEPG